MWPKMELMKSRKGSDMINHEGFLYRRDKKKLNTINWGQARSQLEFSRGAQPIFL